MIEKCIAVNESLRKRIIMEALRILRVNTISQPLTLFDINGAYMDYLYHSFLNPHDLIELSDLFYSEALYRSIDSRTIIDVII